MILNSLVENLQSQVKYHEELQEVLEAESQLTPYTSLFDLERVIEKRDQLSEQIAGLEVGRLKMVQAYLEEKGLQPDLTLEQLVPSLPAKSGQDLLALKAQLLVLIEPIQSLAKSNARQAQARANCFSEVSNSMHLARQRTVTYSQYGQMQTPAGSVYLTRSI